MKTVKLPSFEKMLIGYKFYDESQYSSYGWNKIANQFARAIRTKDGTLKTRSLNIVLYNNILYYENNNSQEFEYRFDTNTVAEQWWKTHIGTKIVKK